MTTGTQLLATVTGKELLEIHQNHILIDNSHMFFGTHLTKHKETVFSVFKRVREDQGCYELVVKMDKPVPFGMTELQHLSYNPKLIEWFETH